MTTLLKPDERTTEVFEFLLEAVAPRLILTHGIDAATELRAVSTSVPIREESHLSRGWSGDRARRLGEELRAQYVSLAQH